MGIYSKKKMVITNMQCVNYGVYRGGYKRYILEIMYTLKYKVPHITIQINVEKKNK